MLPNSTQYDTLDLPDGELRLYPRFLPTAQADSLFQHLEQEIAWQQDNIELFGRRVPIPRLQAWYGEAAYRYSGLQLTPHPWTRTLQELRSHIEQLTGHTFNSVLLNYYRSGQDHVSWHSDDEPELGRNPVIASISLGAERRFILRRKRDKEQKQQLRLPHGSLLLMSGALQHHWQHQLAKTRQAVGPRINLTFRYIHPQP